MSDNIRKETAQGLFYQKESEMLERFIANSLEKYKSEKVDAEITALIVPADSYKLTEEAFAASYSQLIDEDIDTAIIIAPTLKSAFPGILLTDYDKFSSPLGLIDIDKDVNESFIKFNSEYFSYNNDFHDNIPYIEIQLPYLSHIFKNKIKIVPVVMGEPNTKYTTALSEAINSAMKEEKKRFLIIAVSNLSEDLQYDVVKETDNMFMSRLLDLNPDYLSEQLAMKEIRASGKGGVVTILRLAKLQEIKNVRILSLYNSADINDEKHKATGYISSVFFKDK